MEVILQQVGALLVSAIPTAALFLVLVVAYEFMVHKPLTATLARRQPFSRRVRWAALYRGRPIQHRGSAERGLDERGNGVRHLFAR